jgi:protein-S-isoprenylcysteine O-methyltransferase Ste14
MCRAQLLPTSVPSSDVTRVVIFVVVTTALAYLSRPSLADPRSHGFYRFFAWDLIVALVLVNFVSFRQWFRDPLSLRQLVSWALLLGSLAPVIPGMHLLRTAGKPEPGVRIDEALMGIERTTQLVTTGVFRYVRHPLYSSLLLVTWGVFFKFPSVPAGALALGASGFLLATAKAEECENACYFGPAYRAYMQTTKMFIPLVF